MLVRLLGGRNAGIEPPLSIFKNADRNYPICGVAENVPGVSYRTGPKGWTDQRPFAEWLRESRNIKPLPNFCTRNSFVDNCSGHRMNEEINESSARLRIDLKYICQNATELVQPCDSFVIEKSGLKKTLG